MKPSFEYICEARAPGRARSHEFPTVDADTARAMCDANGWEFIRLYAPGSDSDRPADQPARGADRPLTNKQIKALVTEARRTYDALRALGVAGQTFEAWRHAVVHATVRRAGLRQCANRHYAALRRTFRELRGAAPGPKAAASRRQSREGGDTMERREQLMHRIANQLGLHAKRVESPITQADMACAAAATLKGGPITEQYMLAIARAKNRAETFEDAGDLLKLPASKLEQLLWTITNRIAAREGRGDPADRNKKQRGK